MKIQKFLFVCLLSVGLLLCSGCGNEYLTVASTEGPTAAPTEAPLDTDTPTRPPEKPSSKPIFSPTEAPTVAPWWPPYDPTVAETEAPLDTDIPTRPPSVDPYDPDFNLEAWPSDQVLSSYGLMSGTLFIPTEGDEYTQNEESLQTIVRKDANGEIQFVLSETEIKIDKETNKALLKMMTAMNSEIEFAESISVHSAYLSYRVYQSTGTTVRLQLIKDGEPKFLNQATGESPAEWLEENAWKYGFILRYPKGNAVEGKEDGLSDVYSYVGIPHAYYITHELNLEEDGIVPTLEDYVNLIKKEGTAQKPISFEVKKSGSDDGVYNVYYVAAKDADKALLREGAEVYGVSGIGDGYIVTSYIRIGKEPVEEEASEEATTSTVSL